jgi:hypothetical protein
MTMHPNDYPVALNKREAGKHATLSDLADSSTGCLIGPLAKGVYNVTSNFPVYVKRGASTMTPATGVLADESTPSVDTPIRGGEVLEIIVEPEDVGVSDYLGCLTAAGTALVMVVKTGNFDRQ